MGSMVTVLFSREERIEGKEITYTCSTEYEREAGGDC